MKNEKILQPDMELIERLFTPGEVYDRLFFESAGEESRLDYNFDNEFFLSVDIDKYEAIKRRVEKYHSRMSHHLDTICYVIAYQSEVEVIHTRKNRKTDANINARERKRQLDQHIELTDILDIFKSGKIHYRENILCEGAFITIALTEDVIVKISSENLLFEIFNHLANFSPSDDLKAQLKSDEFLFQNFTPSSVPSTQHRNGLVHILHIFLQEYAGSDEFKLNSEDKKFIGLILSESGFLDPSAAINSRLDNKRDRIKWPNDSRIYNEQFDSVLSEFYRDNVSKIFESMSEEFYS